MATYIISGAFFEAEKRIYDREAKQFAKAKSSEEWKVTAGTLNPYLPRRQISASEINQWIEEEE